MEENIVKGEEIQRKIKLNLGQLTFEALKNYGDNVLQVDAETDEILTASLLLKQGIRLATFLKEHGVSHGDTISVISENRLEVCLIAVASFFVGATFAPLNPDYTGGELNHALNLSRPKIVFSTPSSLSKLTGITTNHTDIKLIVVFGSHESKKFLQGLDDIIRGAENDEIPTTFAIDSYDPKETVATILCSSGTTGKPKGVMITHENITSCIEILTKVFLQMKKEADSDSSDTITGITPFFHSFGFLAMYLHILRGKRLIVFKKFKPKIFLEAIAKYKLKALVVPPPLLVYLVRDPLVKKYDLSSVKEVYAGASPLNKETEMELKRRFKLRRAGQSYGMTETTWAVIATVNIEGKSGSVGVVLPGMMAKIIDENGRALGKNQRGELCLKGPMIMKGYVGNKEATMHCIDKDKWLHTGDIAYYDEDYHFYIVDRMKELIKYKGFQVAPSELEDLLVSHPSVLDAAVIGLPDEYAGELPMAFVVKKSDQEVTSEVLQEFVNKNVSPHKQLRGGIVFVKEIPRNQGGKILRRILKDSALKTGFKHKL
ncbi:hypothetical protein HHI36_017796 [Cryptolaemus montrouzieri]|uniref:Uncharacterized protein n=1 Tax=Cryptolaemus montrouzieri TaxID=559131 RepID=A0ABD2NP84_9CUCU